MSAKKKPRKSRPAGKAKAARKPARAARVQRGGKAKPQPRAGKKKAQRGGRAQAPKRPGRAAAGGDWRQLTAGEVMQTDVVTVDVNTPLSEVERLLSEARIGGVPVTAEGGRVVGVLSLKDLVDRYTQDPDARPRRGRGFYDVATYDLDDEDLESFEVPAEAEETAGQLMSMQVISVQRGDDLRTVARTMVQNNVHRVLVQDGGRSVGLLSTMDLLRAAAR